MASDLDVAERLRAALDDRVLDVPVGSIHRAARRRRRETVAVIAILVIALIGVSSWRLTAVGGPTVAGFNVIEIDGRHLIGVVKPSVDMTPTIRVGDIVAIDVDAYAHQEPVVGDVVAFRFEQAGCSGVMIKRVVGLPGDTVEERDGRIYTNGALVDGPRGAGSTRSAPSGPWIVEPDHVFVVGDDLDNSNDSRWSVGQVPVADLIGRADLSMPLDRADVPPGPACSAPVASS